MPLTTDEKNIVHAILKQVEEAQTRVGNPFFFAEFADLTRAQQAAVIRPRLDAMLSEAKQRVASFEADNATRLVSFQQAVSALEALVAKFSVQPAPAESTPR